MILCDYGCGKEAKFYFKQAKKWCCEPHWNKCTATRKKLSKSNKFAYDKNPILREEIKQRMLNGQAIHMNNFPRDPKKLEVQKRILREKRTGKPSWCKGLTKEISPGLRKISERMLNGGAVHACSFIKDDSKPENELFYISCKVLPRPIHKYSIYRVGKGKKSYNVDIADPTLGIILEYDGWYHFDTEEHKKYHKRRQQEIKEEGWKFIRYDIFHPFPTLEQLKEDVKKIILMENCE